MMGKPFIGLRLPFHPLVPLAVAKSSNGLEITLDDIFAATFTFLIPSLVRLEPLHIYIFREAYNNSGVKERRLRIGKRGGESS